jgi:hypothetical protein
VLNKSSAKQQAILDRPGVATREFAASATPGSFKFIRLLPKKTGCDAWSKLCDTLIEEFVADPPREFSWLELRSEDELKLIKLAVTDNSRSLSEILGESDPILRDSGPDLNSLLRNSDRYDQLLMLRGLLAFGLLEHCLAKRHRIDYGLHYGHASRKLAVPYRAAEVPSERSEFNFPDTCLLLTTLSYYYQGLTKDQLRAALSSLLKEGTQAQAYFYNMWLDSIRHKIMTSDPKDFDMIDHVNKIDLTNEGKTFDRQNAYQLPKIIKLVLTDI